MLIREFLCIHEYGTVIFHRKYRRTEDTTDVILRSGLISALYNFATETEKDSIDYILMEKVQLFFKKKGLLLFILFIDSSISPNLVKTCEYDFNFFQETFFNSFPEIQWDREIIDLAKFYSFTTTADQILSALGKKLELLKFLHDDGLLVEKDFEELNLGFLGSKVGQRILQRNHDHLAHTLTRNKEFTLIEVDNILSLLEGDHIKRKNLQYVMNCSSCYLHCNRERECFFEELLNTIFGSLDLDTEIELKVLQS